MLKERIEEVTKMNEQFYRAFENLDVGLMDSMWAHQEYVTCIHPGRACPGKGLRRGA